MESIKEKFQEIIKKAKKNKLAGRIKRQSLYELVEDDLSALVIKEAKGCDASNRHRNQIRELIENKFGIKIEDDCNEHFYSKGLNPWDINSVNVDITPESYRKIFPINGRYDNIEHIVLEVYWHRNDTKYSIYVYTEVAKVKGLVFEVCQVESRGGRSVCSANVYYTDNAQENSSYVRGRLYIKDDTDVDFRKVACEIDQKFHGAVELSYVSEVIEETKEKYKEFLL